MKSVNDILPDENDNVSLSAEDVAALPDNYLAPVTSFNNKNGAVTLNSQDIFSTAVEIGDAEDLNGYIIPGLYIQEELNWATKGINYPEKQPGALTVISFFTINSNTITSAHPGDTVAGDTLQLAGINDGSGLIQGYVNRSVAGTWEVSGNFIPTPQGAHCASTLIRIDGTNLMAMQYFQPATHLFLASQPFRNCQYAASDNSLIYCEVRVEDTWYPFTASPTDSTKWGPLIYNASRWGSW